MINDPSFKIFDQWQVQKQAVIQVWADVHVYSSLTDDTIEQAMFTPTKDISENLLELRKKYGEEMTVAVLPLGPLTIPYVEESV